MIDKMNRPVKSFKNACTSAWKWSSRFPVTKVCSYKILKFCISHLSFFLATFFSQAIKLYLGIFLHIIHLKSVNMTLILNNRLFEWEDSKRKITCRLSSTSVTNIKCDGGEGGRRNWGIFGNTSTPPHWSRHWSF